MNNLSILESYLSTSCYLIPIPLGKKGPIHRGWNRSGHCITQPSDLAGVDTSMYNWGLHHGDSGTCALDVDDLPRARQEFASRGLNLDHYLTNHVQIDSGNPGHAKLIFRMPFWQRTLTSKQLTYKSNGSKPQAFLNFRSVTADGFTVQDILPPSIHPTTGRRYQWLNGDHTSLQEIPPELLALWTTYLTEDAAQARLVDSETAQVQSVPEHQVRSALDFADPDLSRDEWYRIGMSIHSAMGDAGYDLFDSWSAGGLKYAGPQDTQTVWNSFHDRTDGVTFRTLWKEACRNGWTGWRVQRVLDRWDVDLAGNEEHGSWTIQEPVQVKNEILTFLDLNQPPLKSESAWTPPTEEQKCSRLLAELERLCPLNLTNGEVLARVQKILLEATLLKNPGYREQVTTKLKQEAQWTNRQLDTHIRYVRREAREIGGEDANVLVFPLVTQDNRPKDHSENMRAICAHEGILIRHNRMTHDVEIYDPNRAAWYEDEKNNLQRAYIRDKCIEHNMPHYRSDDHVNTIGADNSYHPMEDYLDAITWDGRDWFSYVADTVEVKNKWLWLTTLKRWAISVVAAVREKTGSRPPRGVLVMTGEQLVGKTTWFKYLTPEGMFSDGADLNPADKDSVKKATKYTIVELGELDATFRRADISKLKSFISASWDEVRLPYAHKESKWKRRTIFCGTVNEPEFLRDKTGNTRYWVNEVSSINLDAIEHLTKTGEIAQFWAQVDHWFHGGERWWLTPEEYTVLESNNTRYRDMDIYEELLRDVFAWPELEDKTLDPKMGYEFSAVNPMTLREVAVAIGMDMGRNSKDMKGLKAALQRLTGQRSPARTVAAPWDSINHRRDPHARQGRWYSMPFFNMRQTVGRVMTPTLTVMSGGKN